MRFSFFENMGNIPVHLSSAMCKSITSNTAIKEFYMPSLLVFLIVLSKLSSSPPPNISTSFPTPPIYSIMPITHRDIVLHPTFMWSIVRKTVDLSCVSAIDAICGKKVEKQDESVRLFGINFVKKFKAKSKKKKVFLAKESDWLDTEFECK